MRQGLIREARSAKGGSSDKRQAGPLRVRFLCSRNRQRSPTAERVFSGRTDLEVASAGLAPDAEEVVTPEMLEWAEVIFVMEKRRRVTLQRRFGLYLRHAKVVCVDIPDRFEFMDRDLVGRLRHSVKTILGIPRGPGPTPPTARAVTRR